MQNNILWVQFTLFCYSKTKISQVKDTCRVILMHSTKTPRESHFHWQCLCLSSNLHRLILADSWNIVDEEIFFYSSEIYAILVSCHRGIKIRATDLADCVDISSQTILFHFLFYFPNGYLCVGHVVKWKPQCPDVHCNSSSCSWHY